MYIIDTDALILAFRNDFPPENNPGTFWDWLSQKHKEGIIIIPEKVFDEIGAGHDNLLSFLISEKKFKKEPTKNALIYLPQVIESYGDLTEIDLETLENSADPYLVAHALVLNATVVTNETPKPNAAPQNKKVPDICLSNGISYIRYPRFLWEMQGGMNE